MPIPETYLATVHVPESRDYVDLLTARGIPHTTFAVIESDWLDCVLVEYDNDGPRAAYVVTARAGVDAFPQTVYVFTAPLPAGTDVIAVFDQIRQEERARGH